MTGWFECLAQAQDMDINGPFLDIDIGAPDPVQQLGAAVDAILVRHQELEQAILGRPEPDLFTTGADAVTGRVELESARGEGCTFRIRLPLEPGDER